MLKGKSIMELLKEEVINNVSVLGAIVSVCGTLLTRTDSTPLGYSSLPPNFDYPEVKTAIIDSCVSIELSPDEFAIMDILTKYYNRKPVKVIMALNGTNPNIVAEDLTALDTRVTELLNYLRRVRQICNIPYI